MQRNNPPWAIIGAGPVGAMFTSLLATLFPDQAIHAFDKRHVHIRGHGLDIKSDTIARINGILSELAAETRELLTSGALNGDAKQREYYEDIIRRIKDTQQYLSSEVGGKFIRTFQISDMLQQYSKELSPEAVHFHMDMEIKEDDLAALAHPESTAVDADTGEKLNILRNAEWIFGADGSHSGVRRAVFGESSDELRKDVLTYLLEIKLEMNNKDDASGFFDKINRSILPTIKTGRVHIWNQSMDGTATLHIFIDKKVYDALHVKDNQGKYLGEFANPYRRLTDLPDTLKHEIEKVIVNVIDAERIDPSTVKITTIPMHVYKARQLVKMIQQKRFALLGDSGIGLVLARGVNFGFFAAAQYAAAMYRESLKKGFHPEQVADFVNYQRFWDEQHQKLDRLITWLDMNIHVSGNDARELAYRQISILDEYEKTYQRVAALPATLSKEQHASAVKSLADEFLRFIIEKTIIRPESVQKIIQQYINDIFENLMNKEYMAAHNITDLHRCQDQLLANANEKIADAKFEVKLIHTMAKVYEASSSISSVSKIEDDEPALDDPKARAVKLALQKLLGVIKSFNIEQHPEQAHFVFRIDRMYLELERHANKWSNISSRIRRHKLADFINTTSNYLSALPQAGTRAANEFIRQAPEYLPTSLVTDIVKSGNYTFNEIRSLHNQNDQYMIEQGRISLANLIQKENSRSGLWYQLFGNDTDKNRGLQYQKLLAGKDSQEHAETLGLIVLYALFSNTNAGQLRFSILKNMLSPEMAHNKTVNELDVTVMQEVLLNKITDRLQTRQTKPVKYFAGIISQAINLGNADVTAAQFNSLKRMLIQLSGLREIAPGELIPRALRGIASYKLRKEAGEYESFTFTSFSSISSSKVSDSSQEGFSKVSSIFKTAPAKKPVYELILENAENDKSESGMLTRLSIIYALLTSRKNIELSREITRSISANNLENQLDAAQVAEHIENILKARIPQDKLANFPAVMHKLTSGINSGSKLEKELLRLIDMFTQTAPAEEKKVCAFN